MLYTNRNGYKTPRTIEQQKRDDGWYKESDERSYNDNPKVRAEMKVIMERALKALRDDKTRGQTWNWKVSA